MTMCKKINKYIYICIYNMYYYLLLLYNAIYAKQTINKYTNVF